MYFTHPMLSYYYYPILLLLLFLLIKYFVPNLRYLSIKSLSIGNSFLMADPKGPLLDQDEEQALIPSSSLEGKATASPPSPFTFYALSTSPNQTISSSPSFSASPPPSPPPNSLLLGAKTRVDSLSSWLSAGDLLDVHIGLDNGKG